MCSIVLIHPSQFHLSICITAVIFNISEIVLWGRDVMRSDSSASASCLLGAHRPRRAGKSKQAPEDTGSGRRCLLSPGKLWLVAKKKKGIFKLLCILGNLKKKKELCSVQLNTYVAQMLAGGLPTPQELCKISSNLYQRIP